MTKDEADTIAAAVNVLRPAWNPKSVATILMTHHEHRPARQVCLALVWVALDPETKTPARVNEQGPWWDTFDPIKPQDRPRPIDMRCAEHPTETAAGCPICIPKTVTARPWREVFADTREWGAADHAGVAS